MPGPSQAKVDLGPERTRLLAAFADTLIPAGDGFPAAGGVRIVEDFMVRYVAPDGTEPAYLPGVSESDVSTLADRLGSDFVEADEAGRNAAVASFQSAEPALFGAFQLMVYAGYYSRPRVRTAIADELDAGRDFRGAPQPYGYGDVIEEWDESLISGVGGYLGTEDVVPVDRDALEKLVESFGAST
jgi:hypothetical protein